MKNTHDWARRFSKTKDDGAVYALFDEWVQDEDEHHSYPKLAGDGQESIPTKPGLYLWGADRKVNGRRQTVPRYVGRAKGSLYQRFVDQTGRWKPGKGRYLLATGVSAGDFPPQGTLACRFHDKIQKKVDDISNSEYVKTLKRDRGWCNGPAIMRGLKAFPRPLVDSFRSKKPGPRSDLRLRHAVDWALHGGRNLAHLWVAFLPGIAHLEAELIRAAIRWRKKYVLPPLLNREDPGP